MNWRPPDDQKAVDAFFAKYGKKDEAPEPSASPAHSRNGGVPDLSDSEVIDHCRKAGNAAKFSNLYEAGDVSAYNGDDSRADLALLGILTFYTQDADQLERLFNDSALSQRDKWKSRPDYRRRTINKALSQVGETFTPVGEFISTNSTNSANPTNSANSTNRTQPITAAELMDLEFEPARWVVPDVLPEGLMLLAGKPKKGKSWMALGLCEAVAVGGVAFGVKKVEQGDTLYLALEDNKKRLQKRLKKVLDGREAPKRMHVHTEWARLNEGGVEQLDEWLEAHPDARLVVIDTLAKIRKPTRGANIYAEDYAALEQLIPLAAKHGVAIVVVHHLRKQAASDPMDEISSSTGLTGGVDGFLILRRTLGSKGPTLYVDGRDIEEPTEYALHWNINTATWTIEGEAEEVHLSKERADILVTLNRSPEPMTPKETADAMPGAKYNNVKYLMWTMLGDGQLLKDDKGRYSPAHPTKTPVSELVDNVEATNPSTADTYAEIGDSVSGVSGVSEDYEPERELF